MPLRVKDDGKFKIVQISDTHMVTGVGVCKDAIDAHGKPLPERAADSLTVNFLGGILDVEKPDFVILTGDQLHHDILDSQSTLFKVVAPLIERSIPYAAVFGNHDDEGTYALSRESFFFIAHKQSKRSRTHPGCYNLASNILKRQLATLANWIAWQARRRCHYTRICRLVFVGQAQSGLMA
jgi:DNA repair exonuclease SbcCD nuclease subunit